MTTETQHQKNQTTTDVGAMMPSSRAQYAGLIATGGAGLEPTDLGGLYQLAEILSKSKLVPDHFKDDPGSIVLVALQSRQLGVPIVSGLQSSYVVGGKVGWSAVLLEALAKRSPRCEQFYLETISDDEAVYVVKTTEMPTVLRVSYTIEMARKAGLIERNKATWGGSVQDMLVARCRTRAARRYFPEELVGIFSIEELRDAEITANRLVPEDPARPAIPAGRKAEALVSELVDKARQPKNVTPQPAPVPVEPPPAPRILPAEEPAGAEVEEVERVDEAPAADPPNAARPIGEDVAQKFRDTAKRVLGKFGPRGLEAECQRLFGKPLPEIDDEQADKLDEWLAEMAKQP